MPKFSQIFFCLLCKKSIVEEKSHSINHKAVVIQACIFITTLDTVCNNIAINVRLLSWEEHKKEETTSLLLNRLWIGSTRIPYSALYCKRGYRRSLRWWWCLQSLGSILAEYISNNVHFQRHIFAQKLGDCFKLQSWTISTWRCIRYIQFFIEPQFWRRRKLRAA